MPAPRQSFHSRGLVYVGPREFDPSRRRIAINDWRTRMNSDPDLQEIFVSYRYWILSQPLLNCCCAGYRVSWMPEGNKEGIADSFKFVAAALPYARPDEIFMPRQNLTILLIPDSRFFSRGVHDVGEHHCDDAARQHHDRIKRGWLDAFSYWRWILVRFHTTHVAGPELRLLGISKGACLNY